jgi:basic membrane protein A
VPLLRQGANAYALGCQSVRPDCEVVTVYINAYFDPTKSNRASETLIDSGVDVLRNWMDDPGFCQTAQKRGVWAVGNFLDFNDVCPDSIVTSTLWDMTNYFVDWTKKIQNGEWEGGLSKPDFIQVSAKEGEPRLGKFGGFVKDDVKKKVEAVQQQMIDGKKFIVGPIKDTKGRVRIKDGEEVSEEFMYSKWDWYVEGITVSK